MSRWRGPASRWTTVVAALAVVSVCMTGCESQDSEAPAMSATPRPSGLPSSASRPSKSPSSAAVAANVLQVCKHAFEAFRSGGLGDADQMDGLEVELQGMMDVSEHEADQVLRPLQAAAQAIAADGRDLARTALQKRFNRAYYDLARTCRRAGSHVWPR